MALSPNFEVSLEELQQYKEEFAGFRLKVFGTTDTKDLPRFVPNEKGLAAMREIVERQRNRPYSDDRDMIKLLREARSEGMKMKEHIDAPER